MSELFGSEFFLAIAPTVVMSLALAAVAVSYVFLLIRLGKTEKDKLFLQTKIRDHASDILREANEKRLRIIQDASDHAQMIIKQADGLNLETKDKIMLSIREMSKRQEQMLDERRIELARLYDDIEANNRNDLTQRFKVMAGNIENHALAGIVEFREGVEREMIGLKRELKEKIDQEMKRINVDIEDYKAKQMKKVDEKVFEVLQALTREVLGKSLSIKDHEDLVQKALIEMKSQINSEI